MGLDKITEMRKSVNLTLDELAIKSGVPISTIKKISAGVTKNPNIETVKALVHAMGYTLDDLDNLEKTKKSSPNDMLSEEQAAIKLYQVLLNSGFITEGQELTPQQFEFLDGLSIMLSAFFNKP